MNRTFPRFLNTAVSQSTSEVLLNTLEIQPDRLLHLSFYVLCSVLCFDIIFKLSSSSILILKLPPTKMFPFSQPPEKPADKNSRSWPLGGCHLYYATIFISSRDVTVLLRKLEVFSGQSVGPRRPTGRGLNQTTSHSQDWPEEQIALALNATQPRSGFKGS